MTTPPEAVWAEELAWQPAWRLAERIASREISSTEVVESCLDRIEDLDPTLHAFITVARESALADAAAADAATVGGTQLPPLHGVPVALKDEVWTRGIRSTGGSLVYQDFVPSEDGAAAERVRQAGAIIVGKTQMPEFAMWPRSVNRVSAEARNPWDPTRISGASSGGSAACVTAGMAPLAVGSDGGGSTRIPSALCGAFGLHPTPGRIPSRGSFSYSPFGSLGPITRDVRDAALLLAAMAGPDPLDPGSLPGRPPELLRDLDAGVEGLRIAWTGDFGWIPADPRVVEVARTAAERLEAGGAVVDEPSIDIEDVWPVFAVATRGSGVFGPAPLPYVQCDENLRSCLEDPSLLMPGVGDLLQAPPPSVEEYEAAMATVQRVNGQLLSLLERYDVICSPTMPCVAPPIPDGWDTPYPDEHMGTYYTSVVNLLSGTAATYPCGLVDGLPVGLQVMAGPGAEPTVLRACRALERLQPWTARPPL